MKKILVIAAVASLTMVSCKKDYTCECTSSSTAPGSTSSTSKTTLVGVSKKQAKTNCLDVSYDVTAGGSSYTVTRDCSLK